MFLGSLGNWNLLICFCLVSRKQYQLGGVKGRRRFTSTTIGNLEEAGKGKMQRERARVTRNDILHVTTHLRIAADFTDESHLNSHLNIIIFFFLLQGKVMITATG